MQSRVETLLNAVINGETIEGFEPQSRSEAYLLAAVNKSGVTDLPTPQSRLDALLYKLADMMPESYGADFEAGKQAEYDRFWDLYQQNGERTDYRYAFSGIGWNKDTFKPKYDIKPVGNAEQLFYNSQINKSVLYANRISMKELEEHQGIVFDFSQVTNAARMFNQSFFRELNVIDFSKCTNGQYAFTSPTESYSIERIERLILNEKFNYSGGQPFSYCVKLTYAGFEGSIACTGLNLSYCKLLGKESLLAFINCLVDKSTDTSGTVWYATLGSTLLAKLTEEEIAIAEAKGWELR